MAGKGTLASRVAKTGVVFAVSMIALIMIIEFVNGSETVLVFKNDKTVEVLDKGTPTVVTEIEKKVHVKVNEFRQSVGLQHVKYNDKLADIARIHSNDMIVRDYFDHKSPDGCDFACRYVRADFGCHVQVDTVISKGGENLYQIEFEKPLPVFNTEEIATNAVNGWINSEGHLKNLVSPFYQSEGIGVAIGDKKVVVTQNFC